MENVVYEEKVNGETVVIRYPQNGDAKVMCDYINEISKEKTYVTMQGEEMSLPDEEKYLKNQLESIKKKEVVQLLLLVNGKVSGVAAVDLQHKIKSHIGVFGITISRDQRGKGLGKLLMKSVLEESFKKMPKLKIVILECFAENEKAINMYKSFGFVEYGRLPKGNFYKSEFVDDIQMYKNV